MLDLPGDLFLAVLGLIYLNGIKIMCTQPSWPELGRRLVFLFLCVPLRLYLARHSRHIPAAALGIVGAGFLWNAMRAGPCAHDQVGFFGGKVWWPRAIHAALFLMAAAEKTQKRDPQCILYVDVLIGLVLRLLV